MHSVVLTVLQRLVAFAAWRQRRKLLEAVGVMRQRVQLRRRDNELTDVIAKRELCIVAPVSLV